MESLGAVMSSVHTMPPPFLKICGLRRLDDLFRALELGARYAGLIVEVPGSRRSLSLDEAARLASYTPGRIVIVVRDLAEARLREVVETVQPAVVQLHGHEPPEVVTTLRVVFPEVEVWRALGVPPQAADPERELEYLQGEAGLYREAGAAATMLDTRLPAGSGGTGACCDWQVAAKLVRNLRGPVILAGGLRPENVSAAVREVAPAGLDVSSGIETEPGVKSSELMQRLFREWRSIL